MNRKIPCLELFSGAGGLATGIGLAGVEHIGFVEWVKDACNTLRHNYNSRIVHHRDVRDINFRDFGKVDMIAGGPPCQPFSMGGKHKGVSDQRDMFPYACKAISECMPKAFIFENVKGLLRKSFSEYFDYILKQLENPELRKFSDDEEWQSHHRRLIDSSGDNESSGVKYRVDYRLVDAADYGIPQRRERVIIVGIREDIDVQWTFPKQTHSLDALLWTQFGDGSYWKRHKMPPASSELFDPRIRQQAEKIEQNSSLFPPQLKPWRTVRDQLANVPHPDREGSFHAEHILREGAKIYPGHTGSFIDMPSKTLKAGDHGVPGGENMIRYHDGSVRYYTTYEAKLMQTFPHSYGITGAWTSSMKQIGNAVPVDLAYIIGKSVIDAVWGIGAEKENKEVSLVF